MPQCHARARISTGLICVQDLAGQAADAYNEATRKPTTFEKVKGFFSPPTSAERAQAGAADAYAAGKVSHRCEVFWSQLLTTCHCGK